MTPARIWLVQQLVRHAKSMITVVEEWLRREVEESGPSNELK